MDETTNPTAAADYADFVLPGPSPTDGGPYPPRTLQRIGGVCR